MQREEATTSSGLYGGERGAGGKFRKPLARKRPPTPYDRPAKANQSSQSGKQRDGGGWLSKLVSPAYRLISGGATRILPSLFSKSTNALPSSDSRDHEVERDASGDEENDTSNLGISTSTGVASPSSAADRSKWKSDFDGRAEDKKGNLSDDGGLSEIEQLMQGKRFSRDEIKRLTEILDSRAADLSHVEQGKKNSSLREDEGAVVAHEIPRTLIEEKQEDLNRAIWGTSTPLLQSIVQDEVGASPVEIARAYMGSRASDIGFGSKSLISKDERTILRSDEFTSKPIIPSPSSKSLCWPGAMVQDQSAYLTPQNQRGKFGLHNFPRTPYSRTIYSKSKSKLTQSQGGSQGDSNRSSTTSSIPLQHLQTPPIYGQSKLRGKVLDDGYGSVGPIRRIQRKVVAETPSRGSVHLHSSQHYPPKVENSAGFFSAHRKNLEPGATSSTSKFQSVESKPHRFEGGVPTVHPQSSQLAMKILDLIDGKVPSLEEKSAELKLATTWKKPLPSEVTTFISDQGISFRPSGGSDSRKNMNSVDQRFYAHGNEDGGNSGFKVQPQEGSTNEANEAVNKNTSAFSTNIGNAGMIHGGNAGPSLDFKKNSDSQKKGTHEKASVGFDDGKQRERNELWPRYNQINGQDVLKMVRSSTGSEVLNLQKQPRSHSLGGKPNLASISIDKPDPRSTVSFDNSSGFTFPVSASSGVLSEPPTPSIMPSFSASGLHQPKEGAAVPSYSFGSSSATPALVFSFPSTSSASTHVDASDLKFNFGSDKKSRVSFSSVGKDAICF